MAPSSLTCDAACKRNPPSRHACSLILLNSAVSISVFGCGAEGLALLRGRVQASCGAAWPNICLTCTGHAELMQRIGTMGLACQTNRVDAIGLTQVFTTDPNNVLLELNFFGD